ncbi:MAG: PQQ-binding-like beta-propeller repeat protein [Candidatus Bathyarchaeota archaeon]|nr:PQQ-binding-like beta-propeller repeat protein [Candidatus Bathyarchaeota archaeon]
MRTSKRAYATFATILVLFLILSDFMAFSNSDSSIVDASSGPTNVNAAVDYGDLLQYEWPQIHGDSAFTRFSTGPAPEAPDILWKTTIPNIQSYVAAFNGKVFVTTTTEVFALDRNTGDIVWNTTLPAPVRWPTVYKIDETHLVMGKYCLDIETGKILWVSETFSAKAAWWAEGVYSSEEKIFYIQGQSTVQAWNFTDPSKPPTLAWEVHVPGSTSAATGIQYGDGKVFPGSFEPHQMALDAKTGKVLWDAETRGAMTFSGSYYQGKLLKAGEHDNTFYCFNATTGKILWRFNPGTPFGYWVSGCAAAYDKVYELNKDGHLYALDVNTGQLVWKYKGPGFMFWPGWPVVADGKIYATTGQRASPDPLTLEYSKSEFACLDAYTGKLVWRLPIEAHPPRESVAIAYGNLYLIPGCIEENTMDNYITLNEVWAIGAKSWPMWRRDPEHTATGQSGPANLTLRWNFTAGGGVVSSPSVVDRRVYVGSQDKNIYCLDARNGRFLWNFTTGFRIKSSPAVVDGKVYIGPDDGYVYCLDAKNGSLVWKRYAGGYVPAHFDAATKLCSSPTVVGGKMYVGSLDTNVYCLDANLGNVTWIYETAGYITSSPAVVDGAVYITSQEPTSGALYKLDANNGSLIWKLEILYQLTDERGTDMHASPTVADGMVFTSANKLEYYGVNATTGIIEWTYRNIADEFIVGSVTHHDGNLFFIDQFFVVSVDAKSGQPIWNSWLGGEMYVSPTYADGKLYVASDRRAVYVLNATNGEKLSWFETGSNCWSSPTIYEGRVYVGNQDWNVYCLDDFPIISTLITAELDKGEVEIGEAVTGCGQLTPGIAYAPITVTFVKSDGSIDDIQVAALENGSFHFTYTPDVVGNWTVTAWCSGAAYIGHSADLALSVVESQQPPPSNWLGIPKEHFYAAVAIVAVAVITVAAYLLTRKRKKS